MKNAPAARLAPAGRMPPAPNRQAPPDEDDDRIREGDFPAGHVPLYKAGVINGGVPLQMITSYTMDGNGRDRVFIRVMSDAGANHVVTSDVDLARFLSQLVDAQESLED